MWLAALSRLIPRHRWAEVFAVIGARRHGSLHFGAPPGAPTGLSAGAGNGQVTLNWTAPASDGGEQISSCKVYRGTSSGSETLLTTGGCSNLGAVLTCTDTGLTNGQKHFYKVTAVNPVGEGTQSNEASATPTSPSCTPTQLLGNPGFETGTASPWSASSGVISNHSQEPPLRPVGRRAPEGEAEVHR